MADIVVTKKMEGNSSAMDIHKLPDCLINILVFHFCMAELLQKDCNNVWFLIE